MILREILSMCASMRTRVHSHNPSLYAGRKNVKEYLIQIGLQKTVYS